MLSLEIYPSPAIPDVFCVDTYLDAQFVITENLSAREASRRWMEAKAENDRRAMERGALDMGVFGEVRL